jgi:hypothetical protein
MLAPKFFITCSKFGLKSNLWNSSEVEKLFFLKKFLINPREDVHYSMSRAYFLRNPFFNYECPQEAKYVESWPSTTSAWASWSFVIPVDRYGGVHSLLHCRKSRPIFSEIQYMFLITTEAAESR